MRFLINDGYSEKSRAALAGAGMKYAWQLYAELLTSYLPDAKYDVFHPSDEGAEFPRRSELDVYDGVIWTGADLTIFHTHVPSIAAQIKLAQDIYEVGIPSCGSCWGIQMAAVAAGGTVEPNPKGREMGIGRKIILTDEGRNHPMMKGKPLVYDGFESHYDIVVKVPDDGVVLATNDFSPVQAMAVTHKRGTFWATQYHPEYNLYEMARLTAARQKVLTEQDFFVGEDDFKTLVERWELLYHNPDRFDLRWQLGIADSILDANIRRREFANWVEALVLPRARKKK
ncbi:MAG: type 1 glutamine amidotransferase [Alkalispirochaeta sp.]